MALLYLVVKLPSRAPQFVEEGHCQWCNKRLIKEEQYYGLKMTRDANSKLSEINKEG